MTTSRQGKSEREVKGQAQTSPGSPDPEATAQLSSAPFHLEPHVMASSSTACSDILLYMGKHRGLTTARLPFQKILTRRVTSCCQLNYRVDMLTRDSSSTTKQSVGAC